ncbi:hypothetical protein [Bacillus xiapuensis]|uniref:Uncharacterized protein n=1 Tax=Bacillus xiapuensis TaxID=2014075 RepID=A0ABU6N7S6_9BACI|nr:hypothetical protein [Bacillus xiapuensis]
MEYRHNKRIYPSFTRNAYNFSNVLCGNKITRKLYDVPKTILKSLNKVKIPFAVITSSFLFSNITQAATFDIGNHKGIISSIASRGSDNGSALKDITSFVNEIRGVIQWLKNINDHIYQWSLDLLSFTYETLVNVVLHVPLFLFNNSFVKNTSITFSIISISVVILLTMYEMIMKMLRKKHTNFKTVLKKFPIAVGITGFAPFLFEQSFKLINKLTKGITEIGGTILDGKTFANLVTVGSVDTLILLLFDFTLLGLLVPIFLQQGRRWWNLFCLSAITPLALTSWIFDRHSHMFDQWWNSIKRISVIQLVYSVFIVLMGVFIYGTRFISPEYFLIKLIIVIGGLHSLANPPQMVKSYTRGEGDIFDMYDGYKKTALGVFNTATLRNLRPIQFLRKQKQTKLATISKLRKQTGKRYVDDLLKR